MIAERGALIIATFLLVFVAINLVADMLPNFGLNAGSIQAGFTNEKSKISNANCKCEYNSNWQDFMCGNSCGDMKGAFCRTDDDCNLV